MTAFQGKFEWDKNVRKELLFFKYSDIWNTFYIHTVNVLVIEECYSILNRNYIKRLMYVYGNCLELVYLKCLIIICMKGCYDAIFKLNIGVVPGGARECPLCW